MFRKPQEGNILCFGLCLLPPFLFLGYQLEKSGFVFLPPSLRVFTDIDEIPSKPPLLQAERSQLSQPVLIGKVLQSLTVLVALRWTLCSVSRSLLYWEAQAQHSRCGLTVPEQRRRIAFLDLLAILCLMPPRIPSAAFAAKAHCCFVFKLASTRKLSSFSEKFLSGKKCDISAFHFVLLQ